MDKWVNDLRVAIVQRTMEDYRTHMKCGEYEKAWALEKWFVSEWGQALCCDLGEEIIRRLRKEFRYEQ